MFSADWLPLDIGALDVALAPGVERESWPISDDDYRKLCCEIWTSFDRALEKSSEPVRSIFLADTSFIEFVIGVVDVERLKHWSERKGRELRYSSLSEKIYTPDWGLIGEVFEKRFRERPPFTKSRQWYRNLKYHQRFRVSALLHMHSMSALWTLGPPVHSQLHDDFLQSANEATVLVDWQDTIWVRRFAEGSTLTGTCYQRRIATEFEELSHEIWGRLFHLAPKLKWDCVVNASLARARSLIAIYASIVESDRRPRRVYALGENDQLRKIILLGLQDSGTEVIGFLHGDPIFGIYKTPFFVKYAMGHVKQFVVPNKSSADRYRALYGSQDGQLLRPSFRELPRHALLRDIKTEQDRNESSEQNDRVLVVGYPMNARRYYDDPSLHFFVRLKLERVLTRTLRQIGKLVFYKPHPDRLGHVEPYLRDEGARILLGPFQEALSMASTVIFSHPSTSTFGFSLKTTKNLILLDNNYGGWDPQGKSALAKRVHFIEWRETENGEIVLDAQKLRHAVSQESVVDGIRHDKTFIEYYWGEYT